MCGKIQIPVSLSLGVQNLFLHILKKNSDAALETGDNRAGRQTVCWAGAELCCWNSNDLYCYNVKYCWNNPPACWPNYPSYKKQGSKQGNVQKYLSTHMGWKVFLSKSNWYLVEQCPTWLPTLLPLDSCLACHNEPTMLSKLFFVSFPVTPFLTPWK